MQGTMLGSREQVHVQPELLALLDEKRSKRRMMRLVWYADVRHVHGVEATMFAGACQMLTPSQRCE